MKKEVIKEIIKHSPFTFIASILAVVFVIVLNIQQKNISENTFEILHPLHIFASAITTSAIYYKYKKNISNAILIGITGAIFIGSLSDILFPFLGGNMLNLQISFHLPIIEKPIMILSASFFGALIGIKTKITEFPHTMHVFLSIFASLFYILAFTSIITTTQLLIMGVIVFLAVLIPCCISDIIYPLLFIKK